MARARRASCSSTPIATGFSTSSIGPTGQFLSGTPFVKNLTWASGLTPEGRPIVAPNQDATLEGRRICPHVNGATNWYSTSFNPATGLYYVQANEWCGIVTKTPTTWEAGKGFMGGSFRTAVDEPPTERVLRALDVQTGRIVWEVAAGGGRQCRGAVR